MCRLRTRSRTDVDPPRVELPSAGAYRLAAPGAITRYYQGSNRSMSARSIWLAFEDLLSHNGSHLRQERTYVPGIVFTRATLVPVPVSVSVQSQVGVRSKQLDGSRCFCTACKLPTTRILRGIPENKGTSDWNFVSRCVDLENLAVENLTSACRPLPRVVVNLYT